jgi:phage-related minor tail protein
MGGGIMGEAGAEAIMPLTRMADGTLGVKSEGGGGGGQNIMINMTVNTPDADGFRKSKKQISRELARGIRQNTNT